MRTVLPKAGAEMVGTFWLVLGGCGSAVIATSFPDVGIGLLGVSIAFGLTVVTMAYAIGHVSGCHLNPAITIGLWAGDRFEGKNVLVYIVAQVLGSILAAAVLYTVASGRPGFVPGGFASNGFGDLSPGGYSMVSVGLTELLMSALFMIVVMGATYRRAPGGMAPLAIGGCLTLIHLVTIPISNTSVNPARSTGVALFADTAALGQLGLFWVAPMVGAVCGALIYSKTIGVESPR